MRESLFLLGGFGLGDSRRPKHPYFMESRRGKGQAKIQKIFRGGMGYLWTLPIHDC